MGTSNLYKYRFYVQTVFQHSRKSFLQELYPFFLVDKTVSVLVEELEQIGQQFLENTKQLQIK